MLTSFDSSFWIGLIQIIGLDIVLSGDNAVVIALASRHLPARQQRQAIILGTLGAIVMRVGLAALALELLRIPYLKSAGALMLLWIGVKLMAPEDEQAAGGSPVAGLLAAIRTIMVADLVMSLDNVIAVAGAAHGSLALLIFGLGLSIPLVIFGSTLLLRLIDRAPWIVTLGAAILGYVAGEMLWTDPGMTQWNSGWPAWSAHVPPLAGIIAVVTLGHWQSRRIKRGHRDLLQPVPTPNPSEPLQ